MSKRKASRIESDDEDEVVGQEEMEQDVQDSMNVSLSVLTKGGKSSTRAEDVQDIDISFDVIEERSKLIEDIEDPPELCPDLTSEQISTSKLHAVEIRPLQPKQVFNIERRLGEQFVEIQTLSKRIDGTQLNECESIIDCIKLSNDILRESGAGYNDILSREANNVAILTELTQRTVKFKLSDTKQFNWAHFKKSICKEFDTNARLMKFPVDDFYFEKAFPTYLKYSTFDTGFHAQLEQIDAQAIDQDESLKPIRAPARPREKFNKDAASQPAGGVISKEDDREKMIKLEKAVITVEKRFNREPQQVIKLGCDPFSFNNTVQNFQNILFLVSQKTLKLFESDDPNLDSNERLFVISVHNAEKTNFDVPARQPHTLMLQYDMVTWKGWIEKYGFNENFFAAC